MFEHHWPGDVNALVMARGRPFFVIAGFDGLGLSLEISLHVPLQHAKQGSTMPSYSLRRPASAGPQLSATGDKSRFEL